MTKIWTYFLQFFTKQHKINYVRNHTKKIAYDIIKNRTRIDFSNFYITIVELLKNLNENFDNNENTKRNKIHIKFFYFEFRMIDNETFEIFIIRYIVVIVDLQYVDYILIFQLKSKLIFFLRKFIVVFKKTKNYRKFVQKFRHIDQDFQKLKNYRNSKNYVEIYSLIKKNKKHLNVEKVCYKYYQLKHKIDNKNAFCKYILWILKSTKR